MFFTGEILGYAALLWEPGSQPHHMIVITAVASAYLPRVRSFAYPSNVLWYHAFASVGDCKFYV